MNWLARDGLSFGKCGRADRKEEDTQREAERGIKEVGEAVPDFQGLGSK